MFGRKMKLACVALTMAALGCAAPPCRAGAGEQDNLAHLPRREKRVALPQVEGWSAELQDLAKALGENLLIDSPVIRRILNVRDMKQGAPQPSRKVRGIA